MTPAKYAYVIGSAILLVVPALFYTGYGIYFLITDVNVCSTYSPLWVYGIVTFSLIVVSVPIRFLLKYLKCGEANREYLASISPEHLNIKPDWFIWLPVWLMWILYGAVVIYGGYTCDDMESHGLWVWALITFWLNAGIAIILFITFLYYGLCRQKGPASSGPAYERVRGDDEERLRVVGF